MKYVSVVIAIFAVYTEIFHCLGTVFHEQLQVYIPEDSMENSILVQPLNCWIVRCSKGVFFGRFLIENVTILITLKIARFSPSEQVKPGFFISSAD